MLASTAFGLSPSINSFNGGQLMPEMESRFDFGAQAGTFHSKYSSSCRTLENFFPLSQGPAMRRPGTKYIATVKSGSPILLPFDSSVDDTYIIETGNEYMRFYRNGGQITAGGGTEDISALDNIIAHWLMNDNSSNTAVLDDDGNTHDGIASTNTKNIHAEGKVGTGSFNLAAKHSVSVADSADFTFIEGVDGDFSIIGWAFVSDTGIDQTIISKWDETSGSQAREWRLVLDEDRKLRMDIADESILLDSDTISRWKLDDSLQTNVVIDSIGSSAGALTDGVNNYTSDHSVAGKVGNAFEFDGTNDRVTITENGTDITFGDSVNDSPFSISVWINMDDATDFSIFCKREASDNSEYMFYVDGSDKLVGRLADLAGQSNYRGQVSDAAITAQEGSWTHVAMTYNGNEASPSAGVILYVNGSAVASSAGELGAYTAMQNTAAIPYIGFMAFTNKYADGKIDDAIIFDRELTATEVGTLYNADSGRADLGTPYVSVVTDAALSTGWRYVAMTYEGENGAWTGATAGDYMALYVDSAAVAVTATNVASYVKMEDTATVVRIGSQESSTGSIEKLWADRLDAIAVFGDKLSAVEVASLYDATAIYEITTPFIQANLIDIQISQVGDIMYMVDSTNPPQKLTRINHSDWTIVDAPITTGPFQTQNETDTTIDPTGYTFTEDAAADTFTITGSGDLSDIFTIGKNFLIADATSNDGIWAVASTNSTDPFIITVVTSDGQDVVAATGGTLMVKGGPVTLTASANTFFTGHATNGSLWEINQERGASTLTGDLAGNGSSSATSNFTGGYSFTTSGTWVGTVTLERSTDDGASWEGALAPLVDTNFDNPAETEDSVAMYRVTMSNYSSGTCTYVHTISDELNHGIAQIDTYTSETVVSGTIIQNMASGAPTTDWREGYWSDYRGWPKTVTIHQQRLIFGGSDSFPQTVWFGKADSDDYEDFAEGTLDTSSFTIALEGRNPITWLLGEDYLFMGTSGSVGRYGNNGEAHTPTSPNYREQSRNGAKNIQAELAGNAILYVERASRKVREFGFSLSADKYQSTDLTQISADITEGGIIDVAFQLRPDPVLWCVLDGDIATLTYLREQSVVAWSLQNTDGDFESVAVIPSSDEDEVWVIANRDTGRFVEQFQPRDWGSDDDDAWYVDAGISYSGVATDSFTGATHLANEVVSVYADGIIQDDVTVAGDGTFTIDTAAENVIVGLPYTSKLETMPLITGQEDSFFNKKIRFINADLFESKTMSYSNRPEINLTDVNFFDTAGTSQPLYTSERSPKHLSWVYGATKKQTVYIETSEPAPLTIRAIGVDYVMGR